MSFIKANGLFVICLCLFMIAAESWKPLFTKTIFKPVSEALMDTTSNKVFIRARGIPNKKREYMGWFALYDREFEIKEIVKANPSKSGKCP